MRRISENWQGAIAKQSPLNAMLSHDGIIEYPNRPAPTALAIFGFAQIGLDELPVDDPAWAIWGCNSGWWYTRDHQDRFRADIWADLHPLSVQTPIELEAIRGCPVPIFLTDAPDTTIPNGLQFPLEAILARFGSTVPFACTFAYQIAWAITQGFSRIGVYGIELQLGTLRERTVERASVAYWIGYARGLGIEVITPLGSGVVSHPHHYGFDYHAEKDLIDAYQAEVASVAAHWLARQKFNAYRKTYHPEDGLIG